MLVQTVSRTAPTQLYRRVGGLRIASVRDAALDPESIYSDHPQHGDIPDVMTLDGRWVPLLSNRGDGRRSRRRASQFNGRRDFKPIPSVMRLSCAGHLDASESQFYAEQLKHMIGTQWEEDLQAINARSVIPLYFANDPGARTINWRQTRLYGEAQIVSDWGQDIPIAEASGEELEGKVRSLRVKTQQNIEDIRAAAKAGVNLEENEARAARRAILKKENDVAWDGHPATGLRGFTEDDAVPRVAATGTFAALAANPEDLEYEMHACANGVVERTEFEVPDVMALPTEQYHIAAVTRIGDASGMTVLQSFLQNSPYIRSVVRVRELKGRGTGGTDVMACFRRSIDKLRLNVVLELEVLPPSVRGGVTETVWHQKTGGVTWHKPLSAELREGI